MDILFNNHALQDSILQNPAELIINNEKLIELDETKKWNLLVVVLTIIAILIFGLVSFLAYNTYKDELLKEDKILHKKSKWKLRGKWLNE